MLELEKRVRAQGYHFIAGVDEAGRGPLAGPVVASAVVLKNYRFQNKITDSKKLTPLQRERAFIEIYHKAYVGIGIISESVIDQINILEATFRAMTQAVERLIPRLPLTNFRQKDWPSQMYLLIDGTQFKTDLPYAYQTIPKGDLLCLSIACASIVAKVTRDRILSLYDRIFPQYGFQRHKGYPTFQHKQAIKSFGLSLIHRRTFRCL